MRANADDFECPKCMCTILEMIEQGCTVTTIVNTNEISCVEHGTVVRYQCAACHHEVKFDESKKA